MRVHFRPFLLPALLFATAVGSSAFADSPADESSDFVRIRRGKSDEPVALETAIAGYTAEDGKLRGVTVDLIGVIHVADKRYYDDLNRRLRSYDAVLYELVAPEDANVPQPGRGPGSAVGGLQVGMKTMLELEFQLDCIDYKPKNMVHADMSPEEFANTMKKRNESFLGTFFRIMGRGFAEQSKDPFGSGDLKILAALFAEDRAYQLKLVLAEQFEEMEDQIDLFDGPEGSTIVTERNKKVFQVLVREVKNGKKKIGVFYGAGHLPDMQRRLEKDFGMKRVRTEWISAWSLVRKDSDGDE
jgi:hypothetical protein